MLNSSDYRIGILIGDGKINMQPVIKVRELEKPGSGSDDRCCVASQPLVGYANSANPPYIST
jgi:hypothetical protein